MASTAATEKLVEVPMDPRLRTKRGRRIIEKEIAAAKEGLSSDSVRLPFGRTMVCVE